MIDSKQAARLRHRKSKGAKLKPSAERALLEYDEKNAARKAGKTDPQPSPETAEGAPAPQPSDVPQDDHGSVEAGAGAAGTTEPDPIEAPPAVVTPASSSSSSSKDWREKYRASAGPAADGREMLCVFIGSQWRDGLKAMEDDLALVGVKPVVAADMLFPVIVLALDQLLPDRAKLTPPIAAAVGSTITTVQRFRHHKKIVEVQKADGSLDDYKRKAAQEAAKRKAAENIRDAEIVTEPAAPSSPATAAPPPAPAPTLEQIKASAPVNHVAPPSGLGIAADGKPYV